MKKDSEMKKVLVCFLAMFSVTVHAADELNGLRDVGSWAGGRAVTYQYDNSDYQTGKAATVRIDHANKGKKRVYFLVENIIEEDVCDKLSDGKEFDLRISKVAGQAIKMVYWCNKFKNSDSRYIRLTPFTEAGASFVIQKFKSAPKSVSFEFNHFKTVLSAVGFSNEWARTGGDAL